MAITSTLACAAAPATPRSATAADVTDAESQIRAALDDFHDAAARADEERYFAHFTSDAVFLGTDATERWDTAAFRAYAHPHFAKGKAWSFRATRRAVTVAPDALHAWFDEDLDTPNMGPARGSGVFVRTSLSAPWRIAQYNLALTIPNEKIDGVKALLAGPPAAPSNTP
jgi:ketosteroid isomerase-like protein